MRMWAEERRAGTVELLLTLPVTIRQAVLGKFLAGWAFLGIALLLTICLPILALVLWGRALDEELGWSDLDEGPW